MNVDDSAVILPLREDEKGAIRLSVHIHFDGTAGGRAWPAPRPGRAAGWVLPALVTLGVAAGVWFGGRAVATRIVEAQLGSLASAAPAATLAESGGDRRGEMPPALAQVLKDPPVVAPGPGVKLGTPSGPSAFGLSE